MHLFTTKASWHFLVVFYAMVCVLAWMRHTPWTTAVQLFRAMFQLDNGSWDFNPLSTSKGSRCPYKKEKHVMSSRRIVANSEYLCASSILIFFGHNTPLTSKGPIVHKCLWKVFNTLIPKYFKYFKCKSLPLSPILKRSKGSRKKMTPAENYGE